MEMPPTLYLPPSQPWSDPISGLCDTLEAIEDQRLKLATSLDPSESNLEKLRDAVLNVSDVRSHSRSEYSFSHSTLLSAYLAKRPDIVRGSASLAALGPQYDPLADKTMWTAVSEISSTRPAIPLVYLRGFSATVEEHLEYSRVFQIKFPGSALEERHFRKRIEGLGLNLVVCRFYVGWTTRDVILRAQEDQEALERGELGTQFGNYMSSIGRGRVKDFNIFVLNLPSTTVHRSQAREITEQFEAFFIALLGTESLNSASGGTTTRWTANNGLFRWRDILSAPPFAESQVIEASDSRYSDNRAQFETAVRKHFQDLKEYFENNGIARVDPQNVHVSLAYFEQIVLAACAVPFNRSGQIITMNVFEVPPASEFNGATRFFGDNPGPTAAFHRRSAAFTFGIPEGDNTSGLLPSEIDVARPLARAGVGFVNVVPFLDTSRVDECMYFLCRFLSSVARAPLVVTNGFKATKLVFSLAQIRDTEWTSPQKRSFYDDLNSSGLSKSSFPAVPGLPSWPSIVIPSFIRDQVGNLIVLEIHPGVWRLILVQLHPGSFAYSPVTASARQELVSLVRFKQSLVQRLLEGRNTTQLTSKAPLIALRQEVQALSKARGLEQAIVRQREFVASRERALAQLRAQPRQQRNEENFQSYIAEQGERRGEVSSSTMKRQNAAHELTEGAPGSEERRAQASRIVSRFEEEEARGLTSSLQSVPHVGPDTSAWFARFVALPPGLDFVRSAQGLQGSIAATAARAADPAKDSAFRAFQSSKATAEYAGRVARSLLPGAAKDAFVDKDGQRERARENFGLDTGAVAARTSWAAANPDRAQQIQRSAQAAKAAKDARDLLERIRRGSFPCRIATTSRQNRLAVGTISSYRLEFGKPVTMVEFPADGVATLNFVLDQTDVGHWTATFTVGDSDDDPDPEVYVCDSRRTASFLQQGTLASTLPHDPELWKPNAQDSGAFLNTLLRLPREANPLLVPVPAPREARQRKGNPSEHAQGGPASASTSRSTTTAEPGSSQAGTSRPISTSIAISTSSAETACRLPRSCQSRKRKAQVVLSIERQEKDGTSP